MNDDRSEHLLPCGICQPWKSASFTTRAELRAHYAQCHREGRSGHTLPEREAMVQIAGEWHEMTEATVDAFVEDLARGPR